MTTKCLDNKIFTFKILLSWRFPRKEAFWTIFLSAPLPTPPLEKRIFYFYCRLAFSECKCKCNVLEITVRAKIITELIPERVGPVIFQSFFLELIAFRPIPVSCPARRAKPENYWKR